MIDFHTHLIYMDEIKTQEEWNIVGKYFTYPDSKYPFGTRSLEEIKIRMDYGKIDSIVVLPVDCERTKKVSLLTNQEVALLRKKFNRIIGFASVDPNKKSVLDDLAEAHALGLVGLKLDSGLQEFSFEDIIDHPMWKQVEAYGWPVVMHVGYSFTPNTSMYSTTVQHIEALAIRYPNINFVIAHWAFPWVMEAVLLAIKFRNVYLDTSMPYFDNPKKYAQFLLERYITPSIVEKSIREKIIFGSNYPRVRMESMAQAYQAWPISDKAKDLLFSGNAERLLNESHGG